jgi:hypothetical protein
MKQMLKVTGVTTELRDSRTFTMIDLPGAEPGVLTSALTRSPHQRELPPDQLLDGKSAVAWRMGDDRLNPQNVK